MNNAPDYERIAEKAGAIFVRSAAGRWAAKDEDGAYVLRGALSRAEAARLFWEDAGIATGRA